jgi:2-polyprenyl-3-methyl-5-hydroxy-6-metoxy-1,4-benzoquinol methylase
VENKIMSSLSKLGIIDEAFVVEYYSRTRDRDDVSVMKCQKSGVIFLSKADSETLMEYEKSEDFTYWGDEERSVVVLKIKEQNEKRYHMLKNFFWDKKWLDIGTGSGGILDLLDPVTSKTIAVEPQKHAREVLCKHNYEVYPTIESTPYDDFDVVTLFHVFEHLQDPVGTLFSIKEKMSKGSKIIIEIPHARDFLLSFFELEEFKRLTFWSEHLVLHTRESIRILLENAGFTNVWIQGYQRYPLANHLYWLAKRKPGGHNLWAHLSSKELDSAYSNMLNSLDSTDTLIVIGEKQ